MKKVIYALFILLFSFKVKAICNVNDIIRLKSYINNINYAYDYYINDDEAYFDVLLSNIPDNVYFVDNLNNKFSYLNTNNGELTLKSYKNNIELKFYSLECNNDEIGTISITFPVYNKYYNKKICENFNDMIWCKKWGNKIYTEEEIASLINEYIKMNNKNNLKNDAIDDDIFEKINKYYVKYFYIVLALIIVVSLFLIFYISKKDKFELYS